MHGVWVTTRGRAGTQVSLRGEGKVLPLRPQFLVKCFHSERKLRNDGYPTSWILLHMGAGIPLFIHSLADKRYFVKNHISLFPGSSSICLAISGWQRNLFLSQNYDTVRIFQRIIASVDQKKKKSLHQFSWVCPSKIGEFIPLLDWLSELWHPVLSWGVHTEGSMFFPFN